MISRETEAELRRLCEAATLGPWEEVPQSSGGPLIAHRFETGNQMNPTGLRMITFMLQRGNSLKQDQANAALVVAARNHLPAILDQIASDREMREEAAKGLELIAGFAGKTLLGPQSDRECELAHQTGAAQAFNQAAEIASDTLAKLRTAVPDEERQS